MRRHDLEPQPISMLLIVKLLLHQAAATQTEGCSGGDALWELLDAQCRFLGLETGWSRFSTVGTYRAALCKYLLALCVEMVRIMHCAVRTFVCV